MSTDTVNGEVCEDMKQAEQQDDLAVTRAFAPIFKEIRSLDEVYGVIADILLGGKIDDLTEAKKIIDKASKNATLSILYTIFKDIFYRKNGEGIPFVVAIESFYIDPTYRDSYYLHFSSKHFALSRYCMRLFFLDMPALENHIFSKSEEELNKIFIGSSVLRPSVESEYIVGKTLLNPFKFDQFKNKHICVSPYHVSMFSKRLHTVAFPYMMQDGEVITCAETTILHMCDYYSNRYNMYKSVTPSEIARIEEPFTHQRIVPSEGLSYKSVSQILMKLNFYPRLYGFEDKEPAAQRKRIMHCYIDSAIPVAVSLTPKGEKTEAHSVVCIGMPTQYPYDSKYVFSNEECFCLNMADLNTEYIIMDDSSAPYVNMTFEIDQDKPENQMIQIDGKGNEFSLTSLIAPLSKRMFVDALDAYEIALQVISGSEIGFTKAVEPLGEKSIYYNVGRTEDNPLIFRLLLARASSFRRKRSHDMKNKTSFVWQTYNSIPLPKFVWICELYSKECLKHNKVIGEIVIDATADKFAGISSVVLLNYPHRFAFRLPEEKLSSFQYRFREKELESWEELNPYRHLRDLDGA